MQGSLMLSQGTFHIFSSHLGAHIHGLKQCMYLFICMKLNEAGSQKAWLLLFISPIFAV